MCWLSSNHTNRTDAQPDAISVTVEPASVFMTIRLLARDVAHAEAMRVALGGGVRR